MRRKVLQALTASHKPLGAYYSIEQVAVQCPCPAPITFYRAGKPVCALILVAPYHFNVQGG